LGLGLDSVIFLEDDARECAEVRRNCPEVITLQVPASSLELARFVRHVWPLDRVKARTGEDTKRAQFYVEHGERKSFERQAADLNEFLAGLRLEIVFAPLTMETLSRVAQLTQRTNQMNTTLSRYTEPELRDALNNGLHAFTTTVRDRFGDYGLVGAVFAREHGEQLRVTDLLLSCRALGRGVEHKMLAHAGDLAERIGLKNVVIDAIRGPRNQPAIEFLRSAVALEMPEGAGSASAVCCAAKLKELAQTSQSRSEPAITTAPNNYAPKALPTAGNIEYQTIATELNTAVKIEQAIKDSRKPMRVPARIVSNPPQTATESKLARVWCDLLGLSAVGIDEDFFELGGHSLLAVQLLSRIHKDAGVELPDRVIYAERLTIANLARSMELVELGIEDRESYEAILAEIESLTDEEVEALLAQEEGEKRRP
jgi:acyl carrier protein